MFAATAAVLLAGCNQQASPDRQSAASAAAPRQCADLASLSLPNTTITLAEPVAAGAFQAPAAGLPPGMPPVDYSGLPAFCRVAGTVAPAPTSEIRFEVWLPAENWNGKFLGTGNGGAAGAVFQFAMAEPLARGYAVANTDTGHQGDIGDMSFASSQPEKLTDFNYRAVHEMTVAAKAIVAARYGNAAERSYWNGCSTGGRQGLKEVQRFPEDYDGVIAGAPASNTPGLMAFSILVQQEMTDPNGALPAKLGAIKEAAIAACDAQDGVTDRVIGDPLACEFDPGAMQCAAGAAATDMCLTADEVTSVRRIYGGVVNSRTGEQVFPGTEPGGEPAWGAYGSAQFSIGTSHFRHVVANDPNWDPFTFDFDADVARTAQGASGEGAAMDSDISAFVGRGGKLLIYHGWTDGLIAPLNTVNYYNSVVETIGADSADDSVRLFMLPGVDHCQGGEGAFMVDYLAALENWVENDEAPWRLPAGKPPGAGSFTRRACAYPTVPQYSGTGDVTDGANWWCAGP
jgi:feruloyl esterase